MIKMLMVAILATAFGTEAHAKTNHVLHGLFCNTEAQIDETLAHVARNLPLHVAVEMTNEKTVACVLADRVRYMITLPVIIGQNKGALSLIKYQATLVGVLVGDNIRPVEPPVQIFFVSPAKLEGTEVSRGA